MRGFIFVCLFFSFGLIYPVFAQQQSTAVIEGRVINAETEDPLRGVHVFLAGTKIGTSTNPQGYYRIRDVPAGAHRLVISKVGYGRSALDTLIYAGEMREINIKLKPIVIEMEDLLVEYDEDWLENLQRFKKLFIGESKRAQDVEIVNPQVLRFERRWWGRFTAEAHLPLIIENHSLGYRITYYLDEFRHSGTRTRWDGDPLFQEMTPEDSTQAATWQENRKEAFFGSMRHFFLSLIHDRVREEGFTILRYSRDWRGNVSHNRYRTNASQLISKSDDEDDDLAFKFNFFGRLQVTYHDAEEEEYYREWSRDWSRGPGRPQQSYLELNQRPITIDSDGEILETYGATRFGYFAFNRIAEITPREYRPDDLEW